MYWSVYKNDGHALPKSIQKQHKDVLLIEKSGIKHRHHFPQNTKHSLGPVGYERQKYHIDPAVPDIFRST